MSTETDSEPKDPPAPAKRKRGFIHKTLRFFGVIALLCILALVIARPFLPRVVRWYVNRALDKSVLYRGKIGEVELHLWRGAYSIHNIQIIKTTGDIPVPLFAAKDLDLAVQWDALLHRKVVGRIVIDQPEVNFVDDPAPGKAETGAGGPWLAIIRSLFPFDINSVRVQEGSVHFRTYQKDVPVDVYLSHLNATVDDLTNVSHSVVPLLTQIHATAMAMDEAKLEMLIKLDPFSYDPTFHLGLRLLGLDLTKINDLIETYGGFNVKRGLFDLIVEVDCSEGEATGYIKPLFRNMIVFNLVQDVQEDQNVIQVFWQAIVGGATAIVTNYSRDQLGTLIPFTGNLKTPDVDYLVTIGNLLYNAFIRAFLPRLEKTNPATADLQFGPPSLTDPISVGNEQ